MDPRNLIETLRQRGITLSRKDGHVGVKSTKGELTDGDRDHIRAHKQAILMLLWVPNPQEQNQDLEGWPSYWREAWGYLANELREVSEAGGLPLASSDAGLAAYYFLAWRMTESQSPEQAYSSVREEIALHTSDSERSPWERARRSRRKPRPLGSHRTADHGIHRITPNR